MLLDMVLNPHPDKFVVVQGWTEFWRRRWRVHRGRRRYWTERAWFGNARFWLRKDQPKKIVAFFDLGRRG